MSNTINTNSLIQALLNKAANGSAVEKRVTRNIVADVAPTIGYGVMAGLLDGTRSFRLNDEEIEIGEVKSASELPQKAKPGPKARKAVAA